jgi:hypothetical protein
VASTSHPKLSFKGGAKSSEQSICLEQDNCSGSGELDYSSAIGVGLPLVRKDHSDSFAAGGTCFSNYNTRPRPAEVLVNGAEAELIRPRETVEGLMAGEKL